MERSFFLTQQALAWAEGQSEARRRSLRRRAGKPGLRVGAPSAVRRPPAGPHERSLPPGRSS